MATDQQLTTHTAPPRRSTVARLPRAHGSTRWLTSKRCSDARGSPSKVSSCVASRRGSPALATAATACEQSAPPSRHPGAGSRRVLPESAAAQCVLYMAKWARPAGPALARPYLARP
jgi:hypothetical protein